VGFLSEKGEAGVLSEEGDMGIFSDRDGTFPERRGEVSLKGLD